MEKDNCIICLDSNIKKITNYINTTPLFEQQHIYQCNNCFGYFSYFKKNKNELKKYYTNTASSSIGKKSGYLSNIFAKSVSITRKNYIKKNLKKLNKFNFKNILEIGPGSGHLFQEFNTNEYNRFDAVEEDTSLHPMLLNQNIKLIKYEELINDNYNFIILSHVLEHIIHPYIFLDEIV